MQAKLLRVLQEREVRRIGGERNIPIDVRVIAAANEDIRRLIAENKFRNDLYYRLEVLSLHVPPLRKRKEDIPLLIEYMLQKYGNKYGKTFRKPSESFYEIVCQYAWPGNIRQLENMVERAVVMTEPGGKIENEILQLIRESHEREEEETVSGSVFAEQEKKDGKTLEIPLGRMEDMQRHIVRELVRRKYGTKNEVARALGISRTTLWKLLRDSEPETGTDGHVFKK